MVTQSQRLDAIERQLARINKTLTELERRANQLSNIRLGTVVLGVGASAVLFTLSVPLGWVLLVTTLAAFSVLVWMHRQVQESQRAHNHWHALKSAHLARARLQWDSIPHTPDHPTARHMLDVDMDLSNLHRLLNTATSRGGSLRLREWLIPDHPVAKNTHTRQRRAEELVNRPLFRDKLTLATLTAADDLDQSREGQSLVDWLSSEPPTTGTRIWLLILTALSVFNIINLVLFLSGAEIGTLLSLGFMAYALGFSVQYRRVFAIFEDSLTIEAALRRLNAVMNHLEGWNYANMPATAELIAPVLEQKPSQRLREVTRILSGASLRGNPILWLIVNIIVPWDYYFGWRLEGVKAVLRENLPAWLDVWHEVEALSSLATYAYLHPAYTVPNVNADATPVFTTTQIGHPLIHDTVRVRNDFSFDHLGEIVLITGSNMSGKSSFLRTLGVNLALAYAGGRVCADDLSTAVFRLYTSIRVTDSLDDGISYFYAEVRRLRGLLDALNNTNAPPLFFLIDEIFRGTNNRERLIGSRAYVQALAEKRGVGLVATHDLELAALADVDERIRNAHFREDVHNGRMVFDYTLRTGPSPTTNALRIMAQEGLPVGDTTPQSGD